MSASARSARFLRFVSLCLPVLLLEPVPVGGQKGDVEVMAHLLVLASWCSAPSWPTARRPLVLGNLPEEFPQHPLSAPQRRRVGRCFQARMDELRHLVFRRTDRERGSYRH